MIVPIAEKNARRILLVIGALGFFLFLEACRPAVIQAPAPFPADRHAPFNFEAANGMVVAAHPLAAEAGRDMLKQGGNAVDAAVATAFALNAAEPFASGIGGGGFMVIYLAKEKKVTVINYREEAPASATPSMFAEKGDAAEEWRLEKGTAVGVPGMLAGWNLALTKYGSKSMAACAARAIEIAERGFIVSTTFSTINKDEYERIFKNAGEETCYLNQGIPYEPGETFRNPDLARTLRLIGEKGIGEFYKGTIARKIVEAVQAKGGAITLEDLASYEAKEVAPLKGTYQDCTIYTLPPPASGGMHVLQLLRILESWPLKSWGPNSVAYIHHLSEAMRYLFADHDRYFGDPDFVRIPISELLSKEYAEAIAAKIKPDKTAASYPYATFDAAEGRTGNTTHLGVVDKDGNAVAITQSINDFFATGIVPDGTGFLLNNHMRDFDIDPKSPNAPGPGRRPVSNMGPMMIFKGGSLFLVLGSPGGTRIFPSLTQILANILDFGMDLDTAIEAPRFFTYSTDGKPRPISVESRIPAGVLKALEALGHNIQIKEDYDKYFGGAQALMILRNPRKILGGADSRRDGVGAGY
jgi:gamma-glutamyltranspeptidase/glutathione hydrolase